MRLEVLGHLKNPIASSGCNPRPSGFWHSLFCLRHCTFEDNIQMGNTVKHCEVRRLDSPDSEYGAVAGSCEHGNEHSGSSDTRHLLNC
jgi:hypothetical protein